MVVSCGCSMWSSALTCRALPALLLIERLSRVDAQLKPHERKPIGDISLMSHTRRSRVSECRSTTNAAHSSAADRLYSCRRIARQIDPMRREQIAWDSTDSIAFSLSPQFTLSLPSALDLLGCGFELRLLVAKFAPNLGHAPRHPSR